MTVPTTSWSESSPAGSDNISLGDNRIKEMKTQLREVIGVDHDFPSSGQADDNGQHLRVTLQEQEDIGTGAVGTAILGSQTIATRGELVYTNEDDADIQITKGAFTYPSQSTVLADWAVIMNMIYPVGSVVTLGVSTNPATLYGVGTWTAIAGKVIVGIDGTQTEFDTLNETGGAKTVTLDTTMIPSHNHNIANCTKKGNFANWDATSGSLINSSGYGTPYVTVNTENTGGGQAHSNLQPYIVKYCWERTS